MKQPLTPLAKARDSENDPLAELVRANLAGPDFDASTKERIRRSLRGESAPAWRWRLSPAVAFGALALSSLATAAVLYYRPDVQQLLRPLRRHPASPVVKPHTPPPVPAANVEPAPPVVPDIPAPPAEVQAAVTPEPPLALPVEPPAKPHRRHHRGPTTEVPAPTPPAAPQPTPVASADVAPATPEIPLTPRPAPVAGGPAPETPRAALSREMPAFRAVLHALNVDHDGQAALAALDAYQRDFPSGTYREEAYAARVHALILIGRRSEALSELESVSSSELRRMPHGGELVLLRAELLKERGDCATAVSTFNQVLDEGPAGLAERALWGRAGCRAAMGKLEDSRSDLEQYLRLFPNGVFAKKVRAALAAP